MKKIIPENSNWQENNKEICITRISSCNTYHRNHGVLTKHLGSVEAKAQHMFSANFF